MVRQAHLGYAIVAWAAIFAAVHFYWAAGGTAVSTGAAGGAAGGWVAAYIAFIAVLGIAGGAVGLAIARDGAPRVPRRVLLFLARAGATLLLIGVGIAAMRAAAGTDEGWTESPAATAAITLYFLAGGLLYALAARAMRRAPSPKH
jgi:hypothetical protein